MAEDRVLYWSSGSPACWRVIAALEYKGLPYESKALLASKGEHKCDEVFALNPRGQIPTFRDGNAVVNDSGGVLIYLDLQYPDKPLLPADSVLKAAVLQRIFEGSATESLFRPFIKAKVGRGPQLKDEEGTIETMKAELGFWNKHTGKYKFLVSDDLTLADIMVAPFLLAIDRFGATFSEYQNVRKYTDMMKEHPIMVKTAPEHWATDAPMFDFMNVV